MVLIFNPQLSESMLHTLYTLNATLVPSLVLENLPKGIAAHPDIQIHQVDQSTAICAPECYHYYKKKLPSDIHLIAGNTPLTGTYPGDCAYNVARIGDYVFCNTKYIDSRIKEEYQYRNVSVIHINQGYAKCNIAAISDDLLLTEDIGIHNSIMVNQIPVRSVLLPGGEVGLSNYPYGFIGGAGGTGYKITFWYGNLSYCSYGRKVMDMCFDASVSCINLSDEPLTDLGGIICFCSSHISEAEYH